ncbi:hypothetical protein [Dyadobacter sp. 3J3]|uniref:hypothetical protein n=1 Tax=Dyadobacter sp. 3J3 TaxID=2606600 RepID=UPI00135C822B|nr:hypothetical protein [Dyadobacter sp. 3J3]
MTGQELFDKYTDLKNEYAQTLWTARMVMADDEVFFKKLEEAESQGKKIGLVELPEGIVGEHSEIEFI